MTSRLSNATMAAAPATIPRQRPATRQCRNAWPSAVLGSRRPVRPGRSGILAIGPRRVSLLSAAAAALARI